MCSDPFIYFSGRCYGFSYQNVLPGSNEEIGSVTHVGTTGDITSNRVHCRDDVGLPITSVQWFLSGTRPYTATWGDAEAICNNHDAKLVSIHTEDENWYVHTSLGCGCTQTGWSGEGVCWIGLKQPGSTSNNERLPFAWKDGSYYLRTQSPWGPNEPNGVGDGEDCVHNWDRDNTIGDWNDEPCSNVYPYVCVKEALCEPGYYKSASYLGRPEYYSDQNPHDTRKNDINNTVCWNPLLNCNTRDDYPVGCEKIWYRRYGYWYFEYAKTAECCDGDYDIWFNNGNCYDHSYPASAAQPLYSPGQCTKCPNGYWNNGDALMTVCSPCQAGYLGSVGSNSSEISATCSGGLCPEGTYCPTGTYECNPSEGVITNCDPIKCLPGTIGIAGTGHGDVVSACQAGNAGFWSGAGTLSTGEQPCNARKCGFAQAGTADCNGDCPAGYYCTAGTACPGAGTANTAPSCGSVEPAKPNLYWSSAGQLACSRATDGYYTSGGTEQTRSEEIRCPPGYYCFEGQRFLCPKGTYRDAEEGIGVESCTPCTQGFICNLGSVSPTQEDCGADLVEPQTVYCPEGSEERIEVGSGNYSLGVDSPLANRYDQALCPEDSICVNATAYKKISWDQASCDGVSLLGSLTAEEMQLTANIGSTLNVNYHPDLDSGPYSLTYNITAWREKTQTAGCEPNTLERNSGIFEIDSSSGQVRLTRFGGEATTGLNFEICDEVTIRLEYELDVSVVASDVATNSYLTCTVTVEVEDKNDVPVMPATPFYRKISEKTERNVKVSMCDAAAFSRYGCPVGAGDPALQGYDVDGGIEDDTSTLVYSFVLGAHDGPALESNWLFKINSCTGEISTKGDLELSYAVKNLYRFTVQVTDDGNNGRALPVLFAQQDVYIYITDLNDAPTLSVETLYVFENQPAGQVITPATRTFDDEDGDEVFLSLFNNDEGAFVMDPTSPFALRTTGVGASIIDFESAKTSYTIQIQATDGVASTVETFTIQVQNRNDAPTFTSTNRFYIKENAVLGANVCVDSSGVCLNDQPENRVTSSDEDASVTDYTSYTLASVAPHAGITIFNITEDTGQIFVIDPSVLNFEDDSLDYPIYPGRAIQVLVRATSNGVGTGDEVYQYTEQLVTIYLVDENEVPEVATNPELACYETYPLGSRVEGTFSVTDPDNADANILSAPASMQSVTFTLDAGATDLLGAGREFFTVESLGGGVAILKIIRPLDFETTPTGGNCGGDRCYELAVVARDNGGPVQLSVPMTVLVKVYDVNEAPYFLASAPAWSFSIAEDVDDVAAVNVPGAIGLQAIKDDNAGDISNLAYSVVGGTGQTYFEMTTTASPTPSFGIRKKATTQLDYELINKVWTLVIEVEDLGGSSRVGSACAVDLANVPTDNCGGEGAYCDPTTVRCFETCVDSVTPTLSPVLGSAVPYRPVPHQYFCDYSGLTRNTVPVPEKAQVTVSVTVTDANDAPVVEDNTPGVSSCEMYGTVSQTGLNFAQLGVGAVAVTDQDVADTSFVFGKSNGGDNIWTRFTQNTTTGALTSIPTLSLVDGQVYTGDFTVDDGNGGVTTCSYRVVVTFDNESPTLPTLANVPVLENSAGGTVVVAAGAFGTDLSIDGDTIGGDVLTWSTSFNEFFTINSTNGEISLKNSFLNYEAIPGNTLSMIVRVTDDSLAEALSTVTFDITNVNEAPAWVPVGGVLVLQVDEDQAGGADIAAAALSTHTLDPDVGAATPSWYTPTFAIDASTCVGCIWEITNPITGQLGLKTGEVLDFELGTIVWNFDVIMTDGFDGGMQATKSIRIDLQDVNEPPTFSGSEITVTEGTTVANTLVFLQDFSSLVNDQDAVDTLDNLDITFLAGNDDNLFVISEGRLYLNGTLDYEGQYEYSLDVNVEDTDGNAINQIITVWVEDTPDLRIDSITSAGGELACSGDTVTITGANIGLVDQTVTGKTYTVTYVRATEMGDSALSKVYTAVCTRGDLDNTELSCTTEAGVGKDLIWTVEVTVGARAVRAPGYTVTVTTPGPFLKYGEPVITSVTGSVGMDTQGGDALVIQGTCLGTSLDDVDFANDVSSHVEYCFTNVASQVVCLTPSGCSNTVGGNIECTSVPGLGTNYRWFAEIAGQEVSSTLLSGGYLPPVVSAVSNLVIPANGNISSFSYPAFRIDGQQYGAVGVNPDYVKLDFHYDDGEGNVFDGVYDVENCEVGGTPYGSIWCEGPVDPGVGVGLTVRVAFEGQESAFNAGPTFDREAPEFDEISGDGAKKASTVGGQLVAVVGNSFGPACGSVGTEESAGVPCAYIKASSSNGVSTRVSDNSILVYEPRCVVVNDKLLVCSVPAGTGTDLEWDFMVGGQVATNLDVLKAKTLTTYANPTVGAYDGAGAEDAFTRGSEVIEIEGSNFGPLDGAAIVAIYGGEDNPTEFTAVNCTVTTPHTKITCKTAPGAGNSLEWLVTVDTLESTAELTDYAPPQIVSMDLPVSGFLSNDGGETVTLHGSNFGPACDPLTSPTPCYLESVTYGPASAVFAYAGVDCEVLDHDLATCETSPGTGELNVWQVTVKGQLSEYSTQKPSYTRPTIVSLDTNSESTNGGNPIRILGKGFALCDQYSTVSVVWNGATLLSVNNVYDAVGTGPILITPGSCNIGTENRQIEFAVPEMTLSKTATISVQVQSVLLSQTLTSFQVENFEYEDPNLLSIFAAYEDNNSGRILVTVNGENLCASETCCQTYYNGVLATADVVTHSHERVEVVTDGFGSVYVVCGGVQSNTVGFSEVNPQILGTEPTLNTELFDTTGGDLVELWGKFFGVGMPTVTVGGTQVEVVDHQIVLCSNVSAPATFLAAGFAGADQCYRTVIRVPEGAGRNLPISVIKSEDLYSLPSSNYEFLSYNSPNIDSFSGAGFSVINPSNGSLLISLVGTNFGPSSIQNSSVIEIGSGTYPMECVVLTWDHTLVTCETPVGDGVGHAVSLTVGMQTSNSVGSVDYQAPVVTSFFLWNGLTAGFTVGGDKLEVMGTDFGRSYSAACASSTCSSTGPIIMVGGQPCTIVYSDTQKAVCLTPEGEGVGKDVTLVVNTQASPVVAQVFDYQPPSIFFFTPENGPTSGVERDEDVVFTIVGQNFGVDRFTLFFNERVMSQRWAEFGLTGDLIVENSNHTVISMNLPAYFGKNLTVTVEVDGQRSDGPGEPVLYFHYDPPVLGPMSIRDAAGSLVEFSGNQIISLPNVAFNVSHDSFTRRRLHEERNLLQGFGFWDSAGPGLCLGDFRVRKQFWTEALEIAPNGDYVRVYTHYARGDSTCSPSNELFKVEVKGQFVDLNTLHEVVSCGGRIYSDSVASIVITPSNAAGVASLSEGECTCEGAASYAVGAPTNMLTCLATNKCAKLVGFPYERLAVSPTKTLYSIYIISESRDLFLGERGSETLTVLQDQVAFKFSDSPSASVDLSIFDSIIQGPTDGCYRWQDVSTYLKDAQALAEVRGIPLADIPRPCERRALVSITGKNFGIPITFSEGVGSLRVFLYDGAYSYEDAPFVFEATTTTSIGTHSELCPEGTDVLTECAHEHEMIRFWIPYGSGRGLRIRVEVGNQVETATLGFNYLSPSLREADPGTVKYKRGFQDALGEVIEVRGNNFGGIQTPPSVLINGKTCANAQWNRGLTGLDGRPFISCDAPSDVVGPKSLMVCVAHQASMAKVVRSDVDALLSGELVGAWDNLESLANTLDENNQPYFLQVQSISVGRCSAGQHGSMYQLCQDCPPGAICDSGFEEPKAEDTFFRFNVPILDEEGNPTEASSRCQVSSADDDLLTTFPDLVLRETCPVFLKCEPPGACEKFNTCSDGYQYTLKVCEDVRNATGYDNSCNITRDAYTGEFVGVDADCMGNTPEGQTCTSANPEECSKCSVIYNDDPSILPVGQCECSVPNRCSICSVNTHFRLNNECVECPESVETLIVFFILGAIGVVVAGYILSQKKFNLAFISIGVDYFQVLALFASSKVPWPDSILQVFNVFSIFNFNIDILGIECRIPNFEYVTKWWMTMSLPIAGMVILLMINIVYTAIKTARWGRETNFTSHNNALIAIYIVMFYYLYLSVTKQALDVFNCNPVDPYDGYSYTTFTSLDCDGGSLCKCDEPGGVQQSLAPPAIIFLIVYSAGFPFLLGLILYKNRLLVKEDQYLRAAGIGDSRPTNPNAYDIRKRYHKIYYHFKPEHYYWILAIINRKFWVAFSALMFRGNPAFQLSIVLLVLFVSFVSQVLNRPYMSSGERHSVLKGLDSLVERAIQERSLAEYVDINRKVQANIKMATELNRKKKTAKYKGSKGMWGRMSMDMSERQAHMQENKSKRVVAYFFDYNTVEMILLVSRLLVFV